MANMSIDDDCEFLTSIVKHSEKFLCNEIAKTKRELSSCLQTRLNEQDTKIQALENNLLIQAQQIHTLEQKNKSLIEKVNTLEAQASSPLLHSACKSSMERAFTSALYSLNCDNSTPTQNTNLPLFEAITPVRPDAPSTENQVPVQDQPLIPDAESSTNQVPDQPRIFPCKTSLLKRKYSASSTSNLYTDVCSLPEQLRKKLEPFVVENKFTTRDKLNQAQRAFVKFKVDQFQKSGNKMSDDFIQQLILEGVEERMWVNGFKPSSDTTLFTYLQNRVKNERKILARIAFRQNAEERIKCGLKDAESEFDACSLVSFLEGEDDTSL